MLAAGLALSRGFWRLHLHHGAAHAARQQQRHAAGGGVAVAAAAAVRRQHAMATADGGEAGPPPGQLDAAKRRVREEVKGALRALGAAQMAEESAAIAARLLGSAAWAGSPHAVVYVHCAKLREVDTTPLLDAAMTGGKRLYAPRVLDSDANMHFLHMEAWGCLEEVPPFGIREPRPQYADGRPRVDVLESDEPLELVVMPGLGFDRSGRRLGRGGGYYDKFIAAARERAAAHGWAPPLLVALAYRAQLVPEVPVEPHDARVDAIVTADEVIACSHAAAAVLQRASDGGGSGGGGA